MRPLLALGKRRVPEIDQSLPWIDVAIRKDLHGMRVCGRGAIDKDSHEIVLAELIGKREPDHKPHAGLRSDSRSMGGTAYPEGWAPSILRDVIRPTSIRKQRRYQWMNVRL